MSFVRPEAEALTVLTSAVADIASGLLDDRCNADRGR